MNKKKISISMAKIRILSGFIGHLGPYLPGALKESSFPLPVTIVDKETGEEFETQLITLVPIKETIPEVFQYYSEGQLIAAADLLQRHKKSHVNQLAFYLYEHCRPNSHPPVS